MLANDLNHFIVVLHYNSYFIEEPDNLYVNSKIHHYDYYDVDTM